MSFNKFASLVAVLAFVIPGQAITAGFPYQMESFNPSSNPDDGTNFGTGNCWTAASNTDGAAVTLQKCQILRTATQAWTFSAGAPAGTGTGGVGTIKIFGNKCLDVTNGVDQSGTKLQIFTCGSGNINQQWQVSTGDSGINAVKWAKSNRCVDLTDGSQSVGTPLQIWSCSSGNTHQEWVNVYANASPTSEGSTIRLTSARQPRPSRTLCVTANEEQNNALVEMNFCDIDGEGLNWVWEGGSLKTFDKAFCLDVANGANADGTLVQVYQCVNGNTNQQFQFTTDNSIQWKGTNKCIDLTNGIINFGNPLQIWTCTHNGNLNQGWNIVPVATS